MKVLLINKYNYYRGGAETVFLTTKKLLEQAGVETVVFCMDHPQNLETADAKYFVENIDFGKREGLFRELKKLWQSFYSRSAMENLEKLIVAEKPDVAHVHNFMHQLTPAILTVLRRHKIPVVQTLHDFQLVSPAYNMIPQNGECVLPTNSQVISQKMLQNSSVISIWAVVEFWLVKLLKMYREKIDLFIAPSKFLQQTVASQVAVPVEYLPNPVLLPEAPQYVPGEKMVCVTRFIKGKGLGTLIRAMEKLPDKKLQIIGEGPEFLTVKKYLADKKITNVELLGFLEPEELAEKISVARFCLVPSEMCENNPLAVLESMALGKPVLASRIGGIPEMVNEGRDGWLFTPGDAEDLARKIKDIYPQIEMIEQFGRKAQEKISGINKNYVSELLRIYSALINKSGLLG